MTKKAVLLKVAVYKELEAAEISSNKYPFYATLHKKKGFFRPKLEQRSLLGYHTEKDFSDYWNSDGKKWDAAIRIKNNIYKKSKKVDKN